jgi:hypothetical protein
MEYRHEGADMNAVLIDPPEAGVVVVQREHKMEPPVLDVHLQLTQRR